MPIGTRTAIGERPHRVTLEVPGPNVPDGDGGYVPSWVPLVPGAAWASIVPATPADMERIAGGGSTLTTFTRIVRLPFHPGLTTLARLSWSDRHGIAHHASITGVGTSEDEAESVLTCEEQEA